MTVSEVATGPLPEPPGSRPRGAVVRGVLERGARRVDPRRLPAWAQALLVFAAARVLFAYEALRVMAFSRPPGPGAHWTYVGFSHRWDSTWYQRVLVEGYLPTLPHEASGAVAPNTWAFYPLFPQTVRLGEALGLSWAASGICTALGFGALAAVVMRSLVARVAGPRTALWTVLLWSVFPSSFVLGVPYSESLAILLLVSVLWCLQRERYVAAALLLPVVGVARPIAVPLAVVVTVHLVARAAALRGIPRSLWRRELAGPVLAWIASGVAAVLWPLVAWRGTGVRDAYTQTMAAWRSPHEVVPFKPWWGAAQTYLGEHVGPVLLALGVVAFALWVWWRGRAVVGLDLAVWCLAYAGYLLAVLDSFTSLPRYLLPLFPLGAVLAATCHSRAFRWAVATGFAALGLVWIAVFWNSGAVAP